MELLYTLSMLLLGALLTYALIINMLTYGAFWLDKRKAKRHRWRIPEAVLLGMVVLGGGVGAMVGMKQFRHKTKKKKFKYGVPIIFFLELILVVWLFIW